MTEVVQVVVDPYLLALPDPCDSIDDLEQFVNNILAWAEAVDREDIKVLIAQNCIDGLCSDGFYPYDHHRLRTLLSKYETYESPITDEDVSQVIRRLLDQTPYLEDFIGISGIWYEESKTKIEPEVFLTRLKPNTAEALKDSLITLGLWHQNSLILSPEEEFVFATGKNEAISQQDRLLISSEVSTFELFNNSPFSCELPHVVNESFRICYEITDILENIFGYEVEKELWDLQDDLLPCYSDARGNNPFAEWLNSLNDLRGKEIIRYRLTQVKRGTLGDHKSVGQGVVELRLPYGPGYRIYFGWVTTTKLLILCGGDKSTQNSDISNAYSYWRNHNKKE